MTNWQKNLSTYINIYVIDGDTRKDEFSIVYNDYSKHYFVYSHCLRVGFPSLCSLINYITVQIFSLRSTEVKIIMGVYIDKQIICTVSLFVDTDIKEKLDTLDRCINIMHEAYIA
jgi:hypothetical protein